MFFFLSLSTFSIPHYTIYINKKISLHIYIINIGYRNDGTFAVYSIFQSRKRPTFLGLLADFPCFWRERKSLKYTLHRHLPTLRSGGLVSCLKNRPPLETEKALHRYLGLTNPRPPCLFRGWYEMGSHRRLTEGIEAPQKTPDFR